MKRGVLVFAVSAFAAFTGAVWPGVSSAAPPVVVELYTAQGCVACAKAAAHMGDLADEKGVLPLTFSVDYWDYLGWKDTFAKPEFADRQRAYDKRFDVAEPFTPQVVVDGRTQIAAKPEKIDDLVHAARRTPIDSPQMRWRGEDYVAVGSGRLPRGGAGVWLVRYDPKPQEVEVREGDNRGHKVTERNVVVELVRLGAWRGRPVLLKAPAASEDGLKSVVLVQADNGGRILGVLAQP
jgi:hypothetical protein